MELLHARGAPAEPHSLENLVTHPSKKFSSYLESVAPLLKLYFDFGYTYYGCLTAVKTSYWLTSIMQLYHRLMFRAHSGLMSFKVNR